MRMLWDKRLSDYLKSVIEGFHADNDTTRALRRLHIKEVHLKRRNNLQGIRMVRKTRRVIK